MEVQEPENIVVAEAKKEVNNEHKVYILPEENLDVDRDDDNKDVDDIDHQKIYY